MSTEGTLRYSVTLNEFGRKGRKPLVVRNLSIHTAWCIAHRWARKGRVLFGGNLELSNWGVRGGQFPRCYRAAHITLCNV